jgi:hypothetical protein
LPKGNANTPTVYRVSGDKLSFLNDVLLVKTVLISLLVEFNITRYLYLELVCPVIFSIAVQFIRIMPGLP